MSLLKHLHSVSSVQLRIYIIVLAELVKGLLAGSVCRKTYALKPLYLVFIVGIFKLAVFLYNDRKIIHIFVAVFLKKLYQSIG